MGDDGGSRDGYSLLVIPDMEGWVEGQREGESATG